jgi:transcriptional regulator of acetoin/glycerol metabolism
MSRFDTLTRPITPAELDALLAPRDGRTAVGGGSDSCDGSLTPTLRSARVRFERDYIMAALTRSHWRVPDAARALGLERANLYRKMRQLRISRESAAASRAHSSDGVSK